MATKISTSTVYEKWTRIRSTARRLCTAFGQWIGRIISMTARRAGDVWRRWRCCPRVDLFETNNSVELRVDLPGVDADAIDIKVQGRRLTIVGQRLQDRADGGMYRRHERSAGRFVRSVSLPSFVRDEPVGANYHDGVLAVSLSKKGPETHIHVQRESAGSASCCQSNETGWSI